MCVQLLSHHNSFLKKTTVCVQLLVTQTITRLVSWKAPVSTTVSSIHCIQELFRYYVRMFVIITSSAYPGYVASSNSSKDRKPISIRLGCCNRHLHQWYFSCWLEKSAIRTKCVMVTQVKNFHRHQGLWEVHCQSSSLMIHFVLFVFFSVMPARDYPLTILRFQHLWFTGRPSCALLLSNDDIAYDFKRVDIAF